MTRMNEPIGVGRGLVPVCAGAAIALVAPCALAQTYLGTGTLTWEASDGGAWTSGRLETTAPSVMVRLVAGWEGWPTANLGLRGLQFDATTSALPGDRVSQYARVWPFGTAVNQTLAASRFGDVIKIDDARDTMPPGEGARGVFPGQLIPQFGTNFTTANPVTVFQFRLEFGDGAGTRRVESRYVAPVGGNTTDRVMLVYSDWLPDGAWNMPRVATFGVNVVYVPGPGAAAVLGAAGILVVMRRRRG